MIVKPALRTQAVAEYYFSQKLAQIDEMKNAGADIISLGIGSPDQPPSQNVINALINKAITIVRIGLIGGMCHRKQID